MHDDRLVGIGMPVYNGMPHIRQALDSLLRQSHANIHILISDDGSTDGTLEVCEEYARQDSRITLTKQPVRLGAWENFQFVLDNSKARYFMWASQDDIWDRDWIKANIACLSTSHVLSACSFCTIDESGRRVHAFPDSRFSSYKAARVLEIIYSHMQGVLMYGLFDRSRLAQIAHFGRLKEVGPYVDPLFLLKVGVAGQIARSSHSILFKRVYDPGERRNVNPKSIIGNLCSTASYCTSYLRLDAPPVIKAVLAINTLPLFMVMLVNQARGTVYKRQNVKSAKLPSLSRVPQDRRG